MRDRMNVYFPPELLKQISELADRKKLSRSAIVEAGGCFVSVAGRSRTGGKRRLPVAWTGCRVRCSGWSVTSV